MGFKEEDNGLKKKTSRSRIGAYLGLFVSFLCIIWVMQSVEVGQVFKHISAARIEFLLLAVVTTFFSYILRSWRWQFFFASGVPSFGDSFRCLIMGFFTNNILPARMGEFVRAHLGGRATGQSRSTVLATIAGERLADGLAISLFFSVLFCAAASPEELSGAKELTYVAFVFLGACVGTVALLAFREKIFDKLENLGQVMPGHLSTYTLIRIRRFIVGLEPLMVPKKVILLSVQSVLVWSTELLAYYFVTVAFSQSLSIGGLALFLAAVNFSSLIPAGPGGVGVIEAFASLLLFRIGIDRDTGFSMVFTQHSIQYLVVGIPGCYYLFMRMGGRIPSAEKGAELDADLELSQDFADVSGVVGDQEDGRLGPALLKNGHDIDLAKLDAVDISVVLPAYNEEQRLPKTVLETLEYLRSRSLSFEIIIVDDGSSDGTSAVVSRFETLSSSVRLLTYLENRGKGYAVRFGMLNARGSRVLFADADGATPIEELARLEAAMDNGAQVVIGSRALFSLETEVEAVWYRKLMGRVFNAMVNVVLLPGIADTQCGFKLFTKDVVQAIFNEQREERFAFDVEILFLARKLGCRISEVPVNWHNVPGSKVNVARDSAAMFLSILRVRMRNLFGAYSSLGRLEPVPAIVEQQLSSAAEGAAIEGSVDGGDC